MSVWLDKLGAVWTVVIGRPDGQLCDRNFKNFAEKSFLFESRVRTVLHCHPDGRMTAASNFHIEASCVRTSRMVVRMVDLMHAISIFDARAFGP
jgi:hypothetical protein